MAPEVARRGESVLRASLVALTMTPVCYWRLRGGVSGGQDGKSKWRGVASDDRGGSGGQDERRSDWGEGTNGVRDGDPRRRRDVPGAP